MTDIFNSRYFEFLRKIVETDPECMLNPDVFFPEDYGSEANMAAEVAKSYCQRCPLMRDCARYGIEAKEEFGVWGGLTGADRRKIRRRN
jgi:WhiB family transcriptional regulator, redox-sensing transcriptional regulator